MPAAIAIPVIASAIGGAATVYGAHKAGQANQQALQVQSSADSRQLAFLQQQADEDKRRYDEANALQKQQFDAYQQMRAPYRAAAQSIIRSQMGLPPASPMPQSGTIGGLVASPGQRMVQGGTVGSLMGKG